MSYLYVDETGSKLGIEGGRIIVKTEKRNGKKSSVRDIRGCYST